jgi:hypothetical protein
MKNISLVGRPFLPAPALKNISLVGVLLLLSLPLAGQLTAPKVGTVRYPDGSLHSVQGLANNMIVCDLPFDSADAASFSDQGGIVSQQGAIRLLNADFSVAFEFKTGEPAPVLNMEGDLTSALAWLPSQRTLLRWDGSKFAAFVIPQSDLDGQVTNLQAVNSKQARLLVTGGDGTVSAVTISTRNGSLVSSEALAGLQGYAFSQSFFFVYTENNELVVSNMNGYRRSIALPAPDLIIERMSSQWLHLQSRSLKQDWALHLTQAQFELSILPAIETKKAGAAATVVALRPAAGEPK